MQIQITDIFSEDTRKLIDAAMEELGIQDRIQLITLISSVAADVEIFVKKAAMQELRTKWDDAFTTMLSRLK